MTHIRIRKVSLEKLKKKQTSIQKFIGRRVPMTQLIDTMASKPLFLDDTELKNFKRWKKRL